LDRKSRFIARIPDNEARVGAFASEGWRAGIAKAAEGFTYNRSLEGNLVINAYTTSARGWVVGVGQPEAQLLGPQRSVLESTAWVVGLLTAISLTLAILMARHASRGMEQLAAAATNVGEGRPIPEIVAPFRKRRRSLQPADGV
jgi:hypothetical protein